ncbi:MAG TPA: cupin domain-containing protein [Desulfobacteraceae bacterium]|nr:cupin domain-containing protein [Desulfobacteraceae bacterium]
MSKNALRYEIMKDKDKRIGDEGKEYEDFLSELGERLTDAEAEREFIESFEYEEIEEPQMNVGERLRKVREEKGLSLRDVYHRTDIEESYLKGVEEGKISPPLGVLIKLSKALDMKLGYFISGEEVRPYTIVRKGERKLVSRYDSDRAKYYGYEYLSLAPYKKDRHMEPFLITLKPSKAEEERSSHDGQEFIFVLSGKMEVRLGDEVHVLEPGDSIYYDSTVPHLVKCYGDQEAKILAVIYAER